MTEYQMIKFEEGYKAEPYLCSEGYPTIGTGIKIGPKGASLSNYTFTLPPAVDEVWTKYIMAEKMREMLRNPKINSAIAACDPVRKAVLVSMAYQLGVPGLAKFNKTLTYIAQKKWDLAAEEMLDSLWARQTPNRAKRHSAQMRSGNWAKEYSL